MKSQLVTGGEEGSGGGDREAAHKIGGLAFLGVRGREAGELAAGVVDCSIAGWDAGARVADKT